MKKFSLLLLILMANFAFAKVQTYQLAGTDVYLNFKNVEVGDLEFIKGVNYKKHFLVSSIIR